MTQFSTVLTVGAVLSLTGRFSFQGQQAHQGLTLWADDVTSAGGLPVPDHGTRLPVELLVYDDESRSAPAAEGTERLIVQDRVDLLVGPYSSVLTLAVAPVAERHRKVLWNHGGASDLVARRDFRFIVNLLSPASRYFVGLLEMVRALSSSARRVALLHGAKGAFSAAIVAGIEGYIRDSRFNLVLKAAYPPREADFPALVADVAACQPDVILGAGQTEADLAFARELTTQRVAAELIGLVAAPIQLFKQTLGAQADGFAGPSQWEASVRYQPDIGPTSAEFVARFRERFGTLPDYPAAQAYAAGLVAQACIQRAGTLDDEALREAAGALTLTTFYGDFKLDPATGEQIGHQLLVVQWQGDTKGVVWPPIAAEAPPRFRSTTSGRA